MAIKTYSTTPASNTALFPENMAPSAVNDGMRQVQADVRSWYQDAEWADWGDTPSRASASTFKITGDVTSRYLVDRRIKCNDASTLYGLITASSYSNPDTTVTVLLDTGSLTASLTAVAVGILSPTNSSIPKKVSVLEVQGATTISGAAVMKTTLTVEGATTLSAAATLKTTLTVEGATTLSGAATLKSTLSVEGEATISGTATLKTVVVGDAVADQSAMEAATAVNRIVSPGRQHFHPTHPKAWARVNSSGTILGDYNVASVTKNGTGLYTVTTDVTFSGTGSMCPIITVYETTTTQTSYTAKVTATTTTTVQLLITKDDGAAADAEFFIAILGDL
jgi:hypothetical protein